MDASRPIADTQEGHITYLGTNYANGFGLGAVISGNIGENLYIFSMSTEDLPIEEAKLRFGEDKDSRYYIKDLSKFISMIFNQMGSQVTYQDFTEGSQEFLNNLGRKPFFETRPYFGLIKYQDAYLMDYSEEISLGSFSWFINSQFRKRESYKEDAEFRIVIVIIEKESGRIISIKEPPKILTFPEDTNWDCLSNVPIDFEK
ncbi:hypothetical protein [Hymenobacter sp. PAMC 26628]|uniref:hypothetical protein n=1 Tax=Hymenobacter sp. PAMC 26628 TaxID=1484118 RepID=UPI00138F8026|nr:hypothetical protein [Hymenobacter sp. PAMC 26628]